MYTQKPQNLTDPINTTLEALSILILWNKSWYAHVFFSVMTDNSWSKTYLHKVIFTTRRINVSFS